MGKEIVSPEILDRLERLAGPKGVVVGTDREPHLEEWRGTWRGETPIILAPKTTEELSRLVGVCAEAGVPMVPQGGNTGLVGGQVPAGEVLVTFHRMNAVREVSAEDFTLTCEAGVTLQAAQDAAREAGRLFPLSIGSEGSCQIGGILSTNAGGVHVIRYGNARSLCLGIEAVLPDGRIWNGLSRLRKDNTGYDLKQLFVGGEGTLGFITAAVLKLHPRPAETVTAFLAVPSPQAVIGLLGRVQERSGGAVEAFEYMNPGIVDLVGAKFPDSANPLDGEAPAYVLMELAAGRRGELQSLAETILADAIEDDLVLDGTIAASEAQAEGLWSLRHRASEAMKRDPTYCVKCDISVPIRSIPDFLEAADRRVGTLVPGSRIMAFGHVGDGNIHYDILGPEGIEDARWRDLAEDLTGAVHDIVHEHGGSISAEHGIGQLKRDELPTRKSPVEMELMAAIKRAIDPEGLMNPGKLLAS